MTALFANPLAPLAFVLILAVTPVGHGAPTARLTRDGAIRMADENSRELAVAALEIDRANARLRWAGRLPNPELELSNSTDQFGLNDDEGTFAIAFSQRFPVTSRLKNERVLRRRDVELAEIEFSIRRRQLAFEVDRAWVSLRAAESAVELQRRLIEVNSGIVEFMSKGAEVGEVSSLDAAQAALNGQVLELELGTVEAEKVAAGARLQSLTGIAPGRTVNTTGSLALPEGLPAFKAGLSTVLQNRPDYAALLVADDQSRAQLALAMSQRWDDIAVKLFVESDQSVDEPGGLERNTFAGIGVSIPLPIRNRNEAAIEEAEIGIEKVRREKHAKMFAIESELSAALKALAAYYQLALKSGGGVLGLATKSFEDFKKAHQAGLASYLQVQQAQAQLLQIETAALEQRKKFHLAGVELRFIAGTYPLPDRPGQAPAADGTNSTTNYPTK